MPTLPNARSLARALAALAAGLLAVAARPVVAQVTTVADTTNPSSATVCPGGASKAVDAFTVSGTAPDSITRVRVIISPSGAFVNVGLLEVRSADLATLYGSVQPSADAFYVNLTTPIPVTASPVTELAIEQPKSLR